MTKNWIGAPLFSKTSDFYSLTTVKTRKIDFQNFLQFKIWCQCRCVRATWAEFEIMIFPEFGQQINCNGNVVLFYSERSNFSSMPFLIHPAFPKLNDQKKKCEQKTDLFFDKKYFLEGVWPLWNTEWKIIPNSPKLHVLFLNETVLLRPPSSQVQVPCTCMNTCILKGLLA